MHARNTGINHGFAEIAQRFQVRFPAYVRFARGSEAKQIFSKLHLRMGMPKMNSVLKKT